MYFHLDRGHEYKLPFEQEKFKLFLDFYTPRIV